MARKSAESSAGTFTLLADDDLHLYNEGTHFRAYEKLGAHPVTAAGVAGCYFAVFAPNARSVAVMGEWNGWDKESHPLRPRARSGIWEGFVAGVGAGAIYKYHVVSRYRGYRADKADPFAFAAELPPRTGVGRRASSTSSGGTRNGWRSAGSASARLRPSRSTRSTWGPGGGPGTATAS